ncbi:hypothetical protein Lal_00011098 [Lupinus albus]|nr:hypothetical protein Lal_00011098 [Lupinus albus]
MVGRKLAGEWPVSEPMTEEAPVSLAEAPTRRLNMIEAINDALDLMMERDPDVVVMGEDVGYFGGVFRATAGLQKKYGKTRVFDTPISECGIIGVAVGMGAYGLRPVPEIQFADYIYPGLDQLVSEAARLRYRSAGGFIAPLTVRSPFGGGIFGGQTHSQSPRRCSPTSPGSRRCAQHAARCQGPAHRRDRRQRPGDLLRAEAHLQRPLQRLLRQAGGAVEPPSGQRGARGVLLDPARQGAHRAPWRGGNGAGLWHDGPCGRGGAARKGRRCGDHRPAHAGSARYRDDRAIGAQDGQVPDRPRSDADLRLRRGIVRAGAGTLLLSSRGADRARDGFRHALSAQP